MQNSTITRDEFLGRNKAGGKVYRDAEWGFKYALTACCEAAVTGAGSGPWTLCKGCYARVEEDFTLVECSHGWEYALCRETWSAEVTESVDFAFRHAFDYASEFDLASAEDYAAHIANVVARQGGDVDGIDHTRDYPAWLAAR